jgi:hypothetical protein
MQPIMVPGQQSGRKAKTTTAPPNHVRSDSKMSFYESPTFAALPPPKSQEYMDSLVPPSREKFNRIAQIQREKECQRRRRDKEEQRQALQAAKEQIVQDNPHDQNKAARLIQRTYRGYRARREVQGFGLDAETRWVSALREAQFRQTTRPRATSGTDSSLSPAENPSNARLNWKKAKLVARRAGHDDLDSDSDSSCSDDEERTAEERERIRQQRDKLLEGRKNEAQMMGLQYFLEMVDLKHRYGSNLRMYHAEWKKSDTKENFFYWLDHGSGKNIELDACPRDRLEREKIRYLSREERQYYLVKVDNDGKLRWAKNDVLIDTTEEYKDSIHGIVPVNDPTPPFDPETQPLPSTASMSSSRRSSLSSIESRREADRAKKYTGVEEEEDGEESTGFKKISHISMSTIWNKMLRGTVKNGTWIFVADTSFRLYVGIKNSGAFQHSSFLQGSRISAAGLIKIKNGRISSLSPLSGHYRPPASNFSAFIRSLKEGGVDMSHVSISKSYAILVGLETYSKTRKKGRQILERMTHQKDKVVAPEKMKRLEEEQIDKSQSAQREREVIAEEEARREENRAGVKMMEKLRIAPREATLPTETTGSGHEQISEAA